MSLLPSAFRVPWLTVRRFHCSALLFRLRAESLRIPEVSDALMDTFLYKFCSFFSSALSLPCWFYDFCFWNSHLFASNGHRLIKEKLTLRQLASQQPPQNRLALEKKSERSALRGWELVVRSRSRIDKPSNSSTIPGEPANCGRRRRIQGG